MKCPVCNAWVEVKESRQRGGNIRYRRYQCANMHRFVTHETVVRVIEPRREKKG